MPGRRVLVSIALVLALGCAGARAPAQSTAGAPADAPGAAIRALVARGALGGVRLPDASEYAAIVAAVYEARGFAPLWLDGGEPIGAAHDAVEALADAAAHGLDPRDYDAAPLAREIGRVEDAGAEAQAHFDVALTLAMLRLLSDLHIGRIDPRSVHFGYDVEPRSVDLAALLAEAVREDRVAEAVADASQSLHQARLLEEQLARYRALAADPSLEPPPLAIRPGRKIVTGDAMPEAPALARWLGALGDLPTDLEVGAVYDAALAAGVRGFQARHGLDADGVIGPATARALAVPAAARVRQIELALERLRWIHGIAVGRVVFVNIPGFVLTAFDAIDPDTPPALTMPVVVGKAARTQTPVFAGTMRTVVFAPYWNVPRSIVRGEILPKQARNPGHLASQNMEIVMGGAPVATTPETLAALASGGARLRQRPGAKNALGRVKFLFPNPHDVYLHDTPSQSLFQRSRRDFSHGCIRVAEPEALARWVLAPEGWDAARVAEGLALRSERAVPLAHPFPVVIHYTTAVARRDGTIAFYDDLYGHDAALERALAARYRAAR